MQMVQIPMVISAVTSVVLRPTRSPKCPNIAAPMGRATKASANVASDCRVAIAGAPLGQYCRGRVDIKVVELDGGSDHAGQKNPARLRRIGRESRVEQRATPGFRCEF